MHRAFMLACLLLAAAAPARAQLPPTVQQAAREAEAECRAAGGRPRLMPAFRATLDLNGDGQPDYVHDYTGLDCQGAASFFCGSAGCPVVVFASPGYRAQALGHAQGWTVERGGALPVLVLQAGRGDVRMAWNGREIARLAAGAAPRAPTQAAPQAAPPPGVAAPPTPGAKSAAPAAGAAPAGAWQLRRTPDGTAMAMVQGPGAVLAVGLLCHQGMPVVSLTLRARPPAGPLSASFAGRSGRVALQLAQLGRGDTWIGDLRGTALPGLLAGAEASLDLALNGGAQGRLSLAGSSTAVREALAACHAF